MSARRRVDADRNNAAVLAAAAELFVDPAAVEAVSLADIADRAGVGKGTVSRSFGGKAGLLRALVASRSEPVLASLPDDEPVDAEQAAARTVAAMDALVSVKVAHRAVYLALESLGAGSPYEAPGYDHWWRRLEALLRRAGAADPAFAAHALLAAVRSDLVEHLLNDGAWDEERLRASVLGLARQLAGAGGA